MKNTGHIEYVLQLVMVCFIALWLWCFMAYREGHSVGLLILVGIGLPVFVLCLFGVACFLISPIVEWFGERRSKRQR